MKNITISIIIVFLFIISLNAQSIWIKLVEVKMGDNVGTFYITNIEEKDKFYFDGKLSINGTDEWGITNFNTDCKSNLLNVSKMYMSNGNVYTYNPNKKLQIEKGSPGELAYKYVCPSEGD